MQGRRVPYCSYLHLCGMLVDEWVVVNWAKVEQQKLSFLQLNQEKIRAERYVDLTQAATQPALSSSSVGRRVVLPVHAPL